MGSTTDCSTVCFVETIYGHRNCFTLFTPRQANGSNVNVDVGFIFVTEIYGRPTDRSDWRTTRPLSGVRSRVKEDHGESIEKSYGRGRCAINVKKTNEIKTMPDEMDSTRSIVKCFFCVLLYTTGWVFTHLPHSTKGASVIRYVFPYTALTIFSSKPSALTYLF